MHKNLPKKALQSGQMLIGILISMAIFMILAHALFTLMSSSFELVSFNKARLTGRHLAQQKIETIRNLAYGDIGTDGGIPAGILNPEENIVKNGLNFTVSTQVVYIDDPFDNSAPQDTSPEDYKRVRVEVSWEGVGRSRKNPVVLISDVSANATGTVDGGSLVVLVFNANGSPVAQADVSITTSGVTPAVNLNLETDNEGKIILPGATPCISCYRIVVTKTGFSTDRTYSTSEVTNPIKPDTSVFADDVTQISFAIDALGSLSVNSLDSRENNFAPLPNVSFRIHGNKIIGTDSSSQLVYKYDTTTTTNSSGIRDFNNMEWDVYRISMPASTSYDISGTNPLLPINLIPGGSYDFDFSTATHTLHNFLITIKNPSQELIASASATLAGPGGYNQSDYTGTDGGPDFGQVIFSGLTEDTYQLTATASGFTDYVGNFDVLETTQSEVVLTPL